MFPYLTEAPDPADDASRAAARPADDADAARATGAGGPCGGGGGGDGERLSVRESRRVAALDLQLLLQRVDL